MLSSRTAVAGVIILALAGGVVLLGTSEPEEFGSAEEVKPVVLPDYPVQGPKIRAEWRIRRVEKRIPPWTTLQDVLFDLDFSAEEVHRLVTESRDTYNLNRVAAGHRLVVERYSNDRFRRLEYQIDEESYLSIHLKDGQFRAEVKKLDLVTKTARIFGRIADNLWNALLEQGEDPQLIMAIHEVMQWDIDFTTIQPNDSYKILVEKKYNREEFVKYGELMAMEFNHGGRKFYAFQFENPKTGTKKYFDSEGKGVKKAFLKVPFKYNFRISSGFSYSRLHPVHGKRMPHYGIDYAAPRGTPVLASAAGRVIFAARSGGSGNMVKIKHPNGYTTYYLHLSKILVRMGQSVAQGDIIGRVGSTGTATGPHLDYRIRDKRGKFINPRKFVALPSDKAVDPAHMKDFIAVRDEYLSQLNQIPDSMPPRIPALTAD